MLIPLENNSLPIAALTQDDLICPPPYIDIGQNDPNETEPNEPCWYASADGTIHLNIPRAKEVGRNPLTLSQIIVPGQSDGKRVFHYQMENDSDLAVNTSATCPWNTPFLLECLDASILPLQIPFILNGRARVISIGLENSNRITQMIFSTIMKPDGLYVIWRNGIETKADQIMPPEVLAKLAIADQGFASIAVPPEYLVKAPIDFAADIALNGHSGAGAIEIPATPTLEVAPPIESTPSESNELKPVTAPQRQLETLLAPIPAPRTILYRAPVTLDQAEELNIAILIPNPDSSEISTKALDDFLQLGITNLRTATLQLLLDQTVGRELSIKFKPSATSWSGFRMIIFPEKMHLTDIPSTPIEAKFFSFTGGRMTIIGHTQVPNADGSFMKVLAVAHVPIPSPESPGFLSIFDSAGTESPESLERFMGILSGQYARLVPSDFNTQKNARDEYVLQLATSMPDQASKNIPVVTDTGASFMLPAGTPIDLVRNPIQNIFLGVDGEWYCTTAVNMQDTFGPLQTYFTESERAAIHGQSISFTNPRQSITLACKHIWPIDPDSTSAIQSQPELASDSPSFFATPPADATLNEAGNRLILARHTTITYPITYPKKPPEIIRERPHFLNLANRNSAYAMMQAKLNKGHKF